MSCHHRFRGAHHAAFAFTILYSTGALLLQGCTDLKRSIGLEKTSPDEFAVESRVPLTMPPDFELRPPQPGASRPQEKSSGQQARQVIEQAGPGEPGKQAPDFRLRRAEDGLPDIGAQPMPDQHNAGHAHAIMVERTHLLAAADPRSDGAALGY